MPRRSAPEELDRPLTPDQLRQLEHSLALLSEPSVLKEYQRVRAWTPSQGEWSMNSSTLTRVRQTEIIFVSAISYQVT